MARSPAYLANVAAQAADDAWQIELQAAFGVAASEMRYLPQGKGSEGSSLRAAYETRIAALEAWLLATSQEGFAEIERKAS